MNLRLGRYKMITRPDVLIGVVLVLTMKLHHLHAVSHRNPTTHKRERAQIELLACCFVNWFWYHLIAEEASISLLVWKRNWLVFVLLVCVNIWFACKTWKKEVSLETGLEATKIALLLSDNSQISSKIDKVFFFLFDAKKWKFWTQCLLFSCFVFGLNSLVGYPLSFPSSKGH